MFVYIAQTLIVSRKQRGLSKLKRIHERGFIILFAHTSASYLDEFPHVVDAWIYRGMAFIPISRYDDAQRAYERALEFSPEPLRQIIWWKKGEMFRQMGDFEAAISCFRFSAELEPREGEFWSRIGETMAMHGDLEYAEEVLRMALTKDCWRSEHIYSVLAQVLTTQGIYSEAKTCYEKALELNPDFALAFRGRSDLEAFDQLKARREVFAGHTSFFDDLDDRPLPFLAQYEPERNGRNPSFWIYYGQALGRLWRFDEACAAFERARRDKTLGTLAHFAWNAEGKMEGERGNYLGAQHCFEKAIAADLQSNHAYIFLASLLFRGGELERAENVLRDTLKLDGDKDEALFNLGGVLLAQERYTEAAQCYREAIKIDPDYTIAKIRLLDIELTLRWQQKHNI